MCDTTTRTATRETQSRRPNRFLALGRRLIVNSHSWGGPKTEPNSTARARPGSKHHIVTDANGTPLAAILTGANAYDVTQLLPLVDAIPPIRGVRGRPLQKPKAIYADRGYDSETHRQALRDRGIKLVIAKRRAEHGSGLGKCRCVVDHPRDFPRARADIAGPGVAREPGDKLPLRAGSKPSPRYRRDLVEIEVGRHARRKRKCVIGAQRDEVAASLEATDRLAAQQPHRHEHRQTAGRVGR